MPRQDATSPIITHDTHLLRHHIQRGLPCAGMEANTGGSLGDGGSASLPSATLYFSNGQCITTHKRSAAQGSLSHT